MNRILIIITLLCISILGFSAVAFANFCPLCLGKVTNEDTVVICDEGHAIHKRCLGDHSADEKIESLKTRSIHCCAQRCTERLYFGIIKAFLPGHSGAILEERLTSAESPEVAGIVGEFTLSGTCGGASPPALSSGESRISFHGSRVTLILNGDAIEFTSTTLEGGGGGPVTLSLERIGDGFPRLSSPWILKFLSSEILVGQPVLAKSGHSPDSLCTALGMPGYSKFHLQRIR